MQLLLLIFLLPQLPAERTVRRHAAKRLTAEVSMESCPDHVKWYALQRARRPW